MQNRKRLPARRSTQKHYLAIGNKIFQCRLNTAQGNRDDDTSNVSTLCSTVCLIFANGVLGILLLLVLCRFFQKTLSKFLQTSEASLGIVRVQVILRHCHQIAHNEAFDHHMVVLFHLAIIALRISQRSTYVVGIH